MVIVTRSAYKKASESLSTSDISYRNIIPPWCSSAKVRERRKSRKLSPSWEIQSSYPLRENIWEYLYEDKEEQNAKRNRRVRRQKKKHKICGKSIAIMCTFMFVTVCMMASLWITNSIPNLDKITRLLQKDTFTSLFQSETGKSLKRNLQDLMTDRQRDTMKNLMEPEVSTAVDAECCFRMRYLAAELSRVEKTLRTTILLRRAAMLTSHSVKADNQPINGEYIQASGVTTGRNTAEWGGLVALWGIVPLWRAARPPHTVLAVRKPTPADCWPFSGSQGELIVELPTVHKVRTVSIEHVRPDAAKSAPKHFNIYGIYENNTWIRAIKGEYRSDGPPKQYYPMTSETPLKRVVFRVLSNQGNPKYTCLYRFHVYGVKDNLTIL